MHHILEKILARWSHYLITHPWHVIAGSLLPCLFFALFLFQTPLNLSFMALMDTKDPLVQRYLNVVEKVQLSSQIIVLLEGEDEEELDEVQLQLEKNLQAQADISYVISTFSNQWAQDNLVWITDDETYSALLARTKNIHDQKARALLEKKNSELADRSLTKVEGARLMIVGLASNPLDVDVNEVIAGRAPYDFLSQKITEWTKDTDIQASLTGLGAIGAQDQKKTLRAISSLTPVSLLLVLFLLRLVEPRWLRLVCIGAPMVIAMFGSLGLVGLILGSLTFTEGFFGLMIFGLGVDFGLHLVVRLREEQALTGEFSQALQKTIVGSGTAVIAGALTTVGAFGVIALSPDPTARHLGTSGCLGLLLCLMLMLSLLPAMWVLLERKKTKHTIPEFRVPGLHHMVHNACMYPKRWILGTVVLCLFSFAGMHKFRMETDLSKIFNRDVPAVQVSDRVKERFKANTTPWVIASPTYKEAIRVHQALNKEPLIDKVFGIGDLFPVDREERHMDLQSRLPDFQKYEKILKTLSFGPINMRIPAQQSLKVLRSFQKSAQMGPPSNQDLPVSLRSQLIGNDGSYLTYAYGKESRYDRLVLRAERLAIESIDPNVAGLGNFVEAATSPYRPWIPPVILGVLGVVALVLLVDLRKPLWIFLAIIPVSVGGVVTFGALCWLDTGFSILLIIVIPLLLGLGVDDGLHVVHRMLEDPDLPAHKAAISVSRAITMTTLTTCISFGVLMFSNHAGMESMAQTLLFGLPVCFISSATLIPACAVLLGMRKGPN